MFTILTLTSGIVNAGEVAFAQNLWVKSQYVGSDGVVFESRPVIQTELVVTKGDCWGSVWISTTGDGWKRRPGEEVDYTASCSRSLSPGVKGSLLVAYYDITAPGGVSDITLGLDTDGGLYVKASWYSIHGGLPFDGGQIVRAGWKKTLSDPLYGWQPAIKGEVAYDFGSFGFQEGFFGRVSVSASKAFGDNTISFGLDFSDSISVNDRHGEASTWIGVSRSF